MGRSRRRGCDWAEDWGSTGTSRRAPVERESLTPWGAPPGGLGAEEIDGTGPCGDLLGGDGGEGGDLGGEGGGRGAVRVAADGVLKEFLKGLGGFVFLGGGGEEGGEPCLYCSRFVSFANESKEWEPKHTSPTIFFRPVGNFDTKFKRSFFGLLSRAEKYYVSYHHYIMRAVRAVPRTEPNPYLFSPLHPGRTGTNSQVGISSQ